MKNLKRVFLLSLCFMATQLSAQKQYTLTSPDSKVETTITADEHLTYTLKVDGHEVMQPTVLSIRLKDGTTWGVHPHVTNVSHKTVDEFVQTPFYRATSIRDHYTSILLRFKGKWGVEFRAYNSGIAYRFINYETRPLVIQQENVRFGFPDNYVATVPYVMNSENKPVAAQFANSFENQYTTGKISELSKSQLMFLPIIVDTGCASDAKWSNVSSDVSSSIPASSSSSTSASSSSSTSASAPSETCSNVQHIKIAITESDLNNYPGMYLQNCDNGLQGVFAPYPKTLKQGGHNRLQMLVTAPEDYIAKVEGKRSFPWRILAVARADKELAENNLSYLLGAPSRIEDTSWIKPGKVAWDWWNDWNLKGVDFRAGINTQTYKYYIDFASQHGIEYVILDEGWAVNLQADLMQVVPEIDLKEIVDYGKSKNVGIILWAGYYAFERDMENVCRHYAAMGVKGFKVDFMNRDDQLMTAFNHRAAEMAARYHLILDLHGSHKPAGINRTWPNVLNVEGVFGLEQMKWVPDETDQMKYDTQIPFLRQLSGPMDYTQGAMRNATRRSYHSSYTQPMSQGTRCHQLALYAVLDSPFNMLCDTPTNYEDEAECVELMAEIPTVWDETKVLQGEVGEYIVTARRKGRTWYIGGITNWTPRTLSVDLSFLGEASRQAVLFRDGINADRNAEDYKKESFQLNPSQPWEIRLAPGGGFVLKVSVQ